MQPADGVRPLGRGAAHRLRPCQPRRCKPCPDGRTCFLRPRLSVWGDRPHRRHRGPPQAHGSPAFAPASDPPSFHEPDPLAPAPHAASAPTFSSTGSSQRQSSALDGDRPSGGNTTASHLAVEIDRSSGTRNSRTTLLQSMCPPDFGASLSSLLFPENSIFLSVSLAKQSKPKQG